MLRDVFDRLAMTWEDYYELAKVYFEHHGDLLIHRGFKTNNGYTYDENGKVRLGIWIRNQRANFSNLSQKRKQLLEEIDFVENVYDDKWKVNYKLAKAYYEHYGNLLIPTIFKTNDGYNYDENGKVRLGFWISNQRAIFSNLSQDKQQLLQEIGFVVNSSEYKWQKNYELAKVYFEHHGNLLIPTTFKTNNGYTYDENGKVRLGFWIRTQRSMFSDLSQEKRQLLKSIGFVEKVFDDKWNKNYEFAKSYFEHYGNLLIPTTFKTNDGFTYEENGSVRLGQWIRFQRRDYYKLSQERRNLLQEIGFVEDKYEDQWYQKYELAKSYYEHHGNLMISPKFKTNNGYTYDENGSINLGIWIRNQIKLTLPDSEKGQLLSSIGMIWNTKKNKDEIISICNEYNIDTAKNNNVIKHISVQELESKIEYLKEHNIPIVDLNGVLIDIFTMSSPAMKEKYGITLEELISEYDIKKQKGKGV